MVRILHIVTYMGRGGLETMLMNYYRQMDKNLIQFDFLVHRQEEADYDREILAAGGKIYRIGRLIPWSPSYKKELVSFFREHPEYRIVHVHQDCLSSVALACAREAGIPVRIAHSHNASQDKNWKYPVKLFYKRKIAANATDLMACSDKAGKWMFGQRHPFQVVPNAVDVNRFAFSEGLRAKIRNELGLDQKFVLGHVGRFHSVKNHRFLLQVFADYHKKNPQSLLLLAGDGPEREAMEQLAQQFQIAESVRFLGSCSNIDELLMAMDVFCFPSLYEGFPVSLVEAQAEGIPCLISDRITRECSVCSDLVQFVPVDQGTEPWVQALEQLQGRKAQRRSRAQAIRDAGFEITCEAHRLQETYLKMAEDLV